MSARGTTSFQLLIVILCVAAFASPADPGTLKDETGRSVSIPLHPRRIVSLAPNVTEILFALGLDPEIVGVSIHCNYPEKAVGRARVGSYISLDVERIVSLAPDLVVATGAGNTREMVERLEKLGLSVYVIFPRKFDNILDSLGHLGQILGREKEASEIIREMTDRRKRVADRVHPLPRPRVLLQIGEAPLVTVGQGSFADDLIRLAGGENIAAREGKMYPRLSLEEVVRRAPQVILVSSMNPQGNHEKTLQSWGRWKTLPAVKEGRIHLIDSDLLDRASPRIIDALEEMAGLFHPDAFRQ